jgi:hypothetical protein
MKYMLGTMGVVGFLALAMVGWSVAGRFMTAKDDMSVAIGIVIVGTILGLIASGVAYVVRRMAKTLSGTASIDASPFKKQ